MNRLLFILILPLLYSFSFSPMSQSIDLSQSRKGAQFLIENPSNSSIAVELTVKERDMDENGEETLRDTKDITVFPPQIIVPAKEKRTIRVSYLAKDIPSGEKNYRVIAEQLPLNVDEKRKERVGVEMLMRFVAALYATPTDAKSDIKLESYSADGKTLTLVIHNSGNKHQLMSNPVLRFTHNGDKQELKAKELQGFSGENVLAGKRRIFKIKSSVTIPSNAKVELKLND
jgi:fimbrial chaperone protein